MEVALSRQHTPNPLVLWSRSGALAAQDSRPARRFVSSSMRVACDVRAGRLYDPVLGAWR